VDLGPLCYLCGGALRASQPARLLRQLTVLVHQRGYLRRAVRARRRLRLAGGT